MITQIPCSSHFRKGLFRVVQLCIHDLYTGLFKKKYTLSKIYFTKAAVVKSMSCVRMERKSLIVLMSMI
jgi:hypothetical protein